MNADDFGYSAGVNLGIIAAHQEGIVTSTTMMMNMPGVQHAFKLARENPELGVGIHLVLTCNKPLSNDVFSLVNEEGNFHSLQEIHQHANMEDVKREFTKQVEAFLESGQKPTHIDSHHHVHANENILPVVIELAEQYQLPIRHFRTLQNEHVNLGEIITTDACNADFYGNDLSVETIEKIIDSYDVDILEIMTHPAYIDQSLYQGSRYSLQRMKELDILTDPRVKEMLMARNIQLITFKHLG